jgi:hypothetical protein
LQHKSGIKTEVKIHSFHCSTQEQGQGEISLQFPPPIPVQISRQPSQQGPVMAAPKPNPITTFNLGLNGEKEFVVACKGRPFSLLTTPQLPTPPVNYVDYGLIQDLRLRMTDLQCRKLFFGGEKLRILGHISTSVQCIVNGSSFGNVHFKAYVIEEAVQHACNCQ